MKYVEEFVYRLRAALFVAGLLAISPAIFLTGCANKAQQSFERPPSPVQVSVADQPGCANLSGRDRQNRRARSGFDSASGLGPDHARFILLTARM